MRESLEALVLPFKVNPAVEAKPFGKLIVVPPAWITYAAVPISLFARLGSIAIALIVSEIATLIGDAYRVEDADGVEPSIV